MSTAYQHIDELQSAFSGKRDAIRVRLAEFAAVPLADQFYELVYCLLTPQSSAVNAARAVRVLQAADIRNRDVPAASLLHGPDYYIRFHNTKALRIAEARQAFGSISTAINGADPPRVQRAWLVQNVRGLGWKEASHFLRNIGRRDLAILDRHILKHLVYHRVIDALPRTMTEKQYLAIEGRFREFAECVGITLDELDLVFWSLETGQILK